MARIYVYPADITGCGAYRMIWPARVLQAQGHDVEIVLPAKRGGSAGISAGLDEHGDPVHVFLPPDADVVVMQRLTFRALARCVPVMRRQGVAVVVDMDDDLSCIHPRNLAFTQMHPSMGHPEHSWRHAEAACHAATMVTVSTPALLPQYAPHGRGVVLYNAVPERYLGIEHVDSDVIGWGGSTNSHPDDLPVVGTALTRLTRRGRRFRVVGPPDEVRLALRLDDEPEATGPVPIEEWPHRLAELGIGIAPLADTRFNRSKSHLKALEYAACGVPWVASPSMEYQRLHQRHRIGLLAEKPKDWQRQLSRLAGDPALRADMSAAGRAVAAALTIEATAWRWLEAWQRAHDLERHAATSAARA